MRVAILPYLLFLGTTRFQASKLWNQHVGIIKHD